MVNIADILSELESLRADFGTKLDNIDTCLTLVATSMAALESKVTDLKRDVSSNSTRINEAEGRIHHAEKTLEKTEAALDSVNKRIAYLESKTDDLENRGRIKNLRLFGIREGAEGQQTLLNFVNDMLTRWLELTPDRALTLERVHRTLASGKPNQHRAVIVRFLKFQEKEFVYRESRRRDITHDGGKISFTQDLSAETVRIRRGFNTLQSCLLTSTPSVDSNTTPANSECYTTARLISSQRHKKSKSSTKASNNSLWCVLCGNHTVTMSLRLHRKISGIVS